ncbi:MAG: hypothetical protein JZD41_02790 [Thermoproteus sp.]|nr:hypothetical protein [Thermoproteus sp.]
MKIGSAIFAVYAQPEFGGSRSSIELGIAYQRVAAGQLAAVFFMAGLLAVGYYLELARR